MLYYVNTTNTHVRQIAGNLRSDDLQEMAALEGNADHVHARLQASRLASFECCTVMIDGVPAGLFGVYWIGRHPDEPETVKPEPGIWALGTELMTSRPVEFLRTAREVIDRWLHRYGDLHGYIWSGNTVHIKWLESLWASFSDTIQAPASGEPFRRFKICANQSASRWRPSPLAVPSPKA
jgi:hypothetical protein